MAFSLEANTFDPNRHTPAARKFLEKLSAVSKRSPKWWEVGAAEHRRLRFEGTADAPAPVLLPSAISYEIPSRDQGRNIPCRVFKPQDGSAPKSLFVHIHGGGWVLYDERYQDVRLQSMADEHKIVCLSVGYRLAPENPFPAAPNDCYDVAEWLVRNSESQFQAPMGFIGGESAGAHASMLTVLHLLNHSDAKIAEFRFRGLLLHYGCYWMRWTPSVYSFARREPNLVLSLESLNAFRDAFLGKGWTQEMLDDPNISPLCAELESLRGRLPPALFTCGSEDYLLDDTTFMSARWIAAGGEVSLSIINGAAHGFIQFDPSIEGSGAIEGKEVTDAFVKDKL